MLRLLSELTYTPQHVLERPKPGPIKWIRNEHSQSDAPVPLLPTVPFTKQYLIWKAQHVTPSICTWGVVEMDTTGNIWWAEVERTKYMGYMELAQNGGTFLQAVRGFGYLFEDSCYALTLLYMGNLWNTSYIMPILIEMIQDRSLCDSITTRQPQSLITTLPYPLHPLLTLYLSCGRVTRHSKSN